jgi:CheY-like chemotaxis protein/two-component sensor histidine kinase
MLDRQSRHMVRLVDDLLDVSRISRGKIELRRDRIDLAEVIKQGVETARPLCNDHGHDLQLALPLEPIYLYGDANRLAQVVGNLVNNACKFTPRGGSVHIHAERDRQSAIIRVRDTGIGLAADQMPRIFDIFSQILPSRDRSRDGLGIGLNIVKKLVELHGGTIEARSAGIDQGSEFVIHLPIADQASPDRPTGTVNEVTPLPSRRILVVDDNVDAATSLALLLRSLGHEIQLAHDGLEAIKAAREIKPSIVLLDIGMPKCNGYDAARAIREFDCGHNIVLIALTGWGQEDDIQRSKDAGFDAHLVKPVDLTALMEVLSRYVGP